MRNKSTSHQASAYPWTDMVQDIAGFAAMITLVLGVAALGMMIH